MIDVQKELGIAQSANPFLFVKVASKTSPLMKKSKLIFKGGI
jgi:hypothetical protein